MCRWIGRGFWEVMVVCAEGRREEVETEGVGARRGRKGEREGVVVR
jgi:hypothetical protein